MPHTKPTLSRAAKALALAAIGLATPGCATYDAPPDVSIADAVDGFLSDPKAPLFVAFSEPIAPDTLTLSVVRKIVDAEGRLGDEDDNPDTELDLLFQHSKEGDLLGVSALEADDTVLRVVPSATPPYGAQLTLLVEPGLADRAGNATDARTRVDFSYAFDLECDAPTTLPSGVYFMLFDIEEPIVTQVQLYGRLEVDPQTGELRAQFTNADRRRTPCPMTCAETEACQTVPDPACVQPSKKAGTVDEFSDYIPNTEPPTGYSFGTTGCAVDQPDGSIVVTIAPTDAVVQSPPVTLRNVTFTTSVMPDGADIVRGTGSLRADDVLLGTSSSGAASGGLTLRFVPEGEAPPGIPGPAPEEP